MRGGDRVLIVICSKLRHEPAHQLKNTAVHETKVHPTPDQLSAYNLGQLPPDQATAIESHIFECEPCCDTIISLAADDTFVGLLKEAQQLPETHLSKYGAVVSLSSCQEVPAPLAEHPRYEVLELIGKGGMGDVYKARHRKMEREVALKVISRGLFRKAEAIDRFHREVKAAAQLSHPNIVTAFDADQAGEFHFMVMEYVDGVDLSRTVRDRGALPAAEACDYIRQAAIGLQHAYQRGMVHRDIKPHNLMITTDGTVKILDFGLASLTPVSADRDRQEVGSDLTAAGSVMGTPDFISPEQATDVRQADIRSDIYSLGATFYFLLSGRAPFCEGSITQKLKSHSCAEPEPLDSFRKDISSELVAVVAKMIAKEPADRFQTPLEVAEALEALVKQTEADDTLTPTPVIKPSRKRTRWSPLTAIATVFFAAVFSGIIYYIQTNNGTVRIEVADESLAVEINGQTVTMKDGNNAPLRIQVGENRLRIRQVDSEYEFETVNFVVRRNDQIAFKVDLIAGGMVVSKDGKRFFEDEEVAVSGMGKVVAFAPEERLQTVSSPVKGFVHQIDERLVEGATVKQGDILLQIQPDASQLIDRLTRNAENLESKLSAERTKANVYGESIVALEEAKAAALAAADTATEAAKSQGDAKERFIQGYEVKTRQARADFERTVLLHERGIVPQGSIEKAQATLDFAAAELDSMKLELQAARQAWEAKKNERAQIEREAQTKIDSAQAMQQNAVQQIAAIEKELHETRVKLSEVDRLLIKAPRDGSLFRARVLEKGRVLNEGEELFAIGPETSERAVEIWLSGSESALVQQGDRVRLEFEGWPVVEPAGVFYGNVFSIAPSPDGTGKFRILITEDADSDWPEERYLRPGVRAKCWFSSNP